jgi:hypothetical protein
MAYGVYWETTRTSALSMLVAQNISTLEETNEVHFEKVLELKSSLRADWRNFHLIPTFTFRHH